MMKYYKRVQSQLKKKSNKCLRKGQLMFNILHEMYPDLAKEIKGSVIDPFFIDSNIPDFIKYIDSRITW